MHRKEISPRKKLQAIVPDLSDPVPNVLDLTVSPIDDKQAILNGSRQLLKD